MEVPNCSHHHRTKVLGMDPINLLKISTKSNPNAVAGAIAGIVRESGNVELQVIGAGALNQAIKAVAIARGFVAPNGLDLVAIPSFQDVEIDGQERTAIRLRIEDRNAVRSQLPHLEVRQIPSPSETISL